MTKEGSRIEDILKEEFSPSAPSRAPSVADTVLALKLRTGDVGPVADLASVISDIDGELSVTYGDLEWTRSQSGARKFLSLYIGGECFAVPLGNIVEIAKLGPITPLPNTPGWLLGITNHEGDLLSVFSLPAMLGAEAQPPGRHTHLVIITQSAGEVLSSFPADEIAQIIHHGDGGFQGHSMQFAGPGGRFISGVIERSAVPVNLLDIEALLGSDEFLGCI